jgi:hypothetical protein
MDRYSVDMAAPKALKTGLPVMMLFEVNGVFTTKYRTLIVLALSFSPKVVSNVVYPITSL